MELLTDWFWNTSMSSLETKIWMGIFLFYIVLAIFFVSKMYYQKKTEDTPTKVWRIISTFLILTCLIPLWFGSEKILPYVGDFWAIIGGLTCVFFTYYMGSLLFGAIKDYYRNNNKTLEPGHWLQLGFAAPFYLGSVVGYYYYFIM